MKNETGAQFKKMPLTGEQVSAHTAVFVQFSREGALQTDFKKRRCIA